MTVKELIARLQQVDPELKVVIHHTDPTDWDYNLPLREQDVRVEEVCYELEDNVVDDETCLVIDFSFE
jgi:hypothetical protein